MFRKAIKKDAKLRLALCGPAGSGKTFTALSIASALGKRIAYVDTEHGSASKYAHTDTCGGPGICPDPSHFEFDVIEPETFDPRELVKLIDAAITQGYEVFCGDSLSHYWMGPGGELDLVDAKAKTTQGNSFAAWKTVTPYHNALVDRMISAPIHVIVTMRTKTEWVVEKNDKGKNEPRKIGMAPVMRDGIEYEFDVCGDLDQDNNLAITKSRCSALAGKVINRPGADMARTLTEWLAGAPRTEPIPDRPIPEELKLAFERIDENGTVRNTYEYLKNELVAAGGTAGKENYDAATAALREKYPKGVTIPQEAVKSCWQDLYMILTDLRAAKEAKETEAELAMAKL